MAGPCPEPPEVAPPPPPNPPAVTTAPPEPPAAPPPAAPQQAPLQQPPAELVPSAVHLAQAKAPTLALWPPVQQVQHLQYVPTQLAPQLIQQTPHVLTQMQPLQPQFALPSALSPMATSPGALGAVQMAPVPLVSMAVPLTSPLILQAQGAPLELGFSKEQCAKIIWLQQEYQAAGDASSAALVARYAAAGVDLSAYLEVVAADQPQMHDPSRRFNGTVRSWNPDGGFGFIVCAESRKVYNKDIFLHKSEIGHEPDLYKLRRRLEFKDGEPVSFQVEYDDKQKPRAKHVELLSQPKEELPEIPQDGALRKHRRRRQRDADGGQTMTIK
ncbi:unnamed protein product [Effrenium voratum]|nr:unnamed protein product [Effrenium voratum]